MNEVFLYHIWKNHLFSIKNLKTESGKCIFVMNLGEKNTNAGPDFLNSKINIGGIEWHGSVEIHVLSSDWEKHNHNNNPRYDNVILHVVWENDKNIFRYTGEKIEVLELKKITDLKSAKKSFFSHQEKGKIPCSSLVKNTAKEIILSQIKKSAYQRVLKKSDFIKNCYLKSEKNWQQTLYMILAYSFGLKINALSFLKLSELVNLKIIKKCSDIFERETLLFGYSGLLPEKSKEPYVIKMIKLYNQLSKKLEHEKMGSQEWLFHKLRPAAFPTLRIAYFASAIDFFDDLFLKVISSETEKDFFVNFLKKIKLSYFWSKHYTFEKQVEKTISPGKDFINSIIINAFVPFLFTFGLVEEKNIYKKKAFQLLTETDAEKNSIINNLSDLKTIPENALHSQGMIELYNNFCLNQKCLECKIGRDAMI